MLTDSSFCAHRNIVHMYEQFVYYEFRTFVKQLYIFMCIDVPTQQSLIYHSANVLRKLIILHTTFVWRAWK